MGKIKYLFKKAFYFAWYRHHFLIPPRVLFRYINSFLKNLKRGNVSSDLYTNQSSYLKWLDDNKEDLKTKKFKYEPLISFIIPTYNISRKYLSECLDSILENGYKNFEICISDDCSTLKETIDTLKEYEKKDKRIRVTYRKENGMISESSNTAIKMAKGEFIVLVDNDDLIDKNALYYIVDALNKDKDLDFIYSDEDRIEFNGKYIEPHFKPDYSPDTLMGLNYICHLSCIRKSLVDKVGGFRKEYDGSQDYDLFLRVLEKTNKVYHIEKILYHWRKTKSSTASYSGNKGYAYLRGKKALEDALKRRGLKGEVLENKNISTYIVKYGHNSPLVSIIIPIKDQIEVTKRCIDSLYNKMNYKNFEIILIDNGSKEEKTKEVLKEYEKKHKNFRVKRIDSEFNYSYLNNEGVKLAKGDFILLLNNDTEVIDPDFLDYMVGYANLKHVGCVGIKLLYPDKKVQHAGVVLGYGGIAGHIYVAASKDDNGLFGRLTMPCNYSAVTAACLLVSKKKYELVGGLDEKLKVALNDVDFNLKLLDKGLYNVCLSNVSMLHYETKTRGYSSSKKENERFISEKEYMLKKWGKRLEKDNYYSKNNF